MLEIGGRGGCLFLFFHSHALRYLNTTCFFTASSIASASYRILLPTRLEIRSPSFVIHANVGSEKARGHLGSEALRKCETAIFAEAKGDVTLCKWAKTRDIDSCTHKKFYVLLAADTLSTCE